VLGVDARVQDAARLGPLTARPALLVEPRQLLALLRLRVAAGAVGSQASEAGAGRGGGIARQTWTNPERGRVKSERNQPSASPSPACGASRIMRTSCGPKTLRCHRNVSSATTWSPSSCCGCSGCSSSATPDALLVRSRSAAPDALLVRSRSAAPDALLVRSRSDVPDPLLVRPRSVAADALLVRSRSSSSDSSSSSSPSSSRRARRAARKGRRRSFSFSFSFSCATTTAVSHACSRLNACNV